MPRTPSEVVRAQFEASNRGDFSANTDAWADDVVLTLGGDYVNAGRYEGKAAVVAFFLDWFIVFPTPHFEIGKLVAEEDRVALTANLSARGRESGVALANDFHYAYWVHDEKVARIEIHDSFDAALAAVGIQNRGDANG